MDTGPYAVATAYHISTKKILKSGLERINHINQKLLIVLTKLHIATAAESKALLILHPLVYNADISTEQLEYALATSTMDTNVKENVTPLSVLISWKDVGLATERYLEQNCFYCYK